MTDTFHDQLLEEVGRRLTGYIMPISLCRCGNQCDIAYVAMCEHEAEPDFTDDGDMRCSICKKPFKPIREYDDY